MCSLLMAVSYAALTSFSVASWRSGCGVLLLARFLDPPRSAACYRNVAVELSCCCYLLLCPSLFRKYPFFIVLILSRLASICFLISSRTTVLLHVVSSSGRVQVFPLLFFWLRRLLVLLVRPSFFAPNPALARRHVCSEEVPHVLA